MAKRRTIGFNQVILKYFYHFISKMLTKNKKKSVKICSILLKRFRQLSATVFISRKLLISYCKKEKERIHN